MVKPGAKIPFDSALPQSAEQSVGLVLPVVLSDRLDSLVALAERLLPEKNGLFRGIEIG